MYDWIEINGVKSTALAGLTALDWSPPLYTRRKRDTEWIPGRIGQVQSQYPTYEEPTATLTLSVVGETEAQLRSRWLAVRKWLARGRRLRLSDQPDTYYLGEITQVTPQDSAVYADGDCWLTATAAWALAPACLIKYRSASEGWAPDLDTPIPQQLTAANATQAKTLTAAGQMDAIAYDGAYPAWLCLRITGAWDTLNVGGVAGLTIHQAAATATTLYIDCLAQVCYALEDGVQVSWAGAISGDYPAPTEDFSLAIGGTGNNVTVQLLVIEMT